MLTPPPRGPPTLPWADLNPLSTHPPKRIVSATDQRKYEDTPGLQDNAEIVFRSLAARLGGFGRWALYGDWVHTREFLGAVLVVTFSVAYDQVGFKTTGLGLVGVAG